MNSQGKYVQIFVKSKKKDTLTHQKVMGKCNFFENNSEKNIYNKRLEDAPMKLKVQCPTCQGKGKLSQSKCCVFNYFYDSVDKGRHGELHGGFQSPGLGS